MSGIGDLREHLFDTIWQLKAGSLDNNTAQSICNVASKLLQSAEIELKLRQMTNDFQSGGGFLIEAGQEGSAPKPLKVTRMAGVWPAAK